MSDWYYAADNAQKGPVNEAELKENLATNKLPADTLVWKDGMDNWTPANQVPAFSFRQPPIPAKVQPSTAGASEARVSTDSPVTPESAHDSTTPVDLATLFGKPEALEVEFEDAEKNKMWGILAYVPLLFWVPLLMAKDSPYGKYHANQGLVLFLTIAVFLFVFSILGVIPFIGFIFHWLSFPIYLCGLVLLILGVVNAAAGKCVPLPLIGGIKLLR